MNQMKKIKVITEHNRDLNFEIEVPEETEITFSRQSLEPFSVLEDYIFPHHMTSAYETWCDNNGYGSYDMYFEEVY